jgi:hypothetical protein
MLAAAVLVSSFEGLLSGVEVASDMNKVRKK